MDNKKIGKLIADLRRKQGLTQEQLGEKVGVGFRSVSKWECGKTLPDIGIINDLSKILGISSDELLSGELKSKEDNSNKKKLSSKITITISILTLIIICISTIFIYEKNKTYSYRISSTEKEEYYVKGTANYNNDGNISIILSDIDFKDEEFNNIIIKNFEYTVSIKDDTIFRYGYIDIIEQLDTALSISKFVETATVNFKAKTKMPKEEIINNDIILKFKFLTEGNQIITKEIKVTLSPAENK